MYKENLQVARSASCACPFSDDSSQLSRSGSVVRVYGGQTIFSDGDGGLQRLGSLFEYIEIPNIINIGPETYGIYSSELMRNGRFSYLCYETLDLTTFLFSGPRRPSVMQTQTHAKTTNFLRKQPRYRHESRFHES